MVTAQKSGPGTAGKALVRTGGTLAPRNHSGYDLARQWYVGQRRFQSIARGLVQLTRFGAMDGEWREQLVQEEGHGWAAQGCDFLLTAETVSGQTGGTGDCH